MNRATRRELSGPSWLLAAAALALGAFPPTTAAAAPVPTGPLQIQVIDGNGNPLSTGFRWLVEEDTSIPVYLGTPDPRSMTVNISRSYAPVAATGRSDGPTAVAEVPSDRPLVVSVLPDGGHDMGGANVPAGAGSVTIRVNANPIPTAQISVFVFGDDRSINGAPDLPAEGGLPHFRIQVSDVFGIVSTDAFGNPLGTTYDEQGSVRTLGTGEVFSDQNGEALIRNLAPGKYGIRAIPPIGTDWIQTSTIEGTPGIDAWVKADEPPYFDEWGLFRWHAFIGFVRPMLLPTRPGVVGTITGQVVYVHQDKPPLQPGLHAGMPVPDCYVGLSDLGNADEQVYTQPCRPDSTFQIRDVPPGTYLLTMWDKALDAIIDFRTVTVPPTGGQVALGPTPIYAWFGNWRGSIFFDTNGNARRDFGEPGMPGQAVNLRYKDGSLYQASATDPSGDYEFREVFPFFWWLVAESDYTRYKPTGMTAIVDAGGPLPPGMDLTPQIQADGSTERTEVGIGEGLTQTFYGLAGTTNVIDWGRTNWGPGENGGISGMVTYETTRAEADPREAVAEDWSPGIPRVQVNLYLDLDRNGGADDVDGDGEQTLADVDNFPFGWQDDPALLGPEDVDRNGNLAFDAGDAIQITHTDSFDDTLPTGCLGTDGFLIHGQQMMDCAEAMPTYNQVRNGIYSGAYAFDTWIPGGAGSGGEEQPLFEGTYIVEAVPPPGYLTQREEDMNVGFGVEYQPKFRMGYPLCVGDRHEVKELALFPGEEGKYFGRVRPTCDRKQIDLFERQNAAANFFQFTEVPKAGRIHGMVLNDLVLEFDPGSPMSGNNLGVAWMPVSIKDFRGREVVRTYTDEWGHYNAMVPGTFTVNVPSPTGVSPNMLQACLNDPGLRLDPATGKPVTDPWYNPSYNQVCTNFDFWPGKTTFLDTPILPIAAFTANKRPVDCDFADHTPEILRLDGTGVGPWVPSANGSTTIRLTAVGDLEVADPDAEAVGAVVPTVVRDYGFGPRSGGSRVTLTANGNEYSLPVVSWSNTEIVARLPLFLPSGHVHVRRGDNLRKTTAGVYLTVGGPQPIRVRPCADPLAFPKPSECSIQYAVDHAPRNALILIEPGIYKENVIVWKRLKIQGTGARSTTLLAGPMSPEETAAWEAKLADLIADGDIELIDGQRSDFFLERGAGFLLANRDSEYPNSARPRIDALTITGAIRGGGILVNAFTRNVEISNNRLVSNQGSLGGGVRVGTPSVVGDSGNDFVTSDNRSVNLHNNVVARNGAVDGGGGVALFNGSDRYTIADNFICGNFSFLYGGGIAHFGESDRGVIRGNRIVSNESMDEGGGLMIAGELVPFGADSEQLTPGSGSVQVLGNWIHGNKAGDDGGGLRLLMINGEDVRDGHGPGTWHTILIYNNLITNNSSADAGGGIALDDAARVFIRHTTVANNDSTGTGVDAFGGTCAAPMPPGQTGCPEGASGGGIASSVPKVAGIASNAHSDGLRQAFRRSQRQAFSDPVIENSIVFHNRAFWWDATYNGGFGGLRPDVAGGEAPAFWDLGVYNTTAAARLDPEFSILSENLAGTGWYSNTNRFQDPNFVQPYVNEYLATAKGAALGNFVVATFIPTGLHGNYHLASPSPAINLGRTSVLFTSTSLFRDIDAEFRPNGARPDAGADEYRTGTVFQLQAPGEVLGGADLQPDPLDAFDFTRVWEAFAALGRIAPKVFAGSTTVRIGGK